MLPVEKANHLPFRYDKDRARGHRGRRRQANRLTGQRPLTEEVAGAQHSHDRLFAGLGEHRQFHAPVLNVEDGVGRIALRVDGRGWLIVHECSRHAGRIEECLRVERVLALRFHPDLLTLCAVRTGFAETGRSS
jgi:hypothetical protein